MNRTDESTNIPAEPRADAGRVQRFVQSNQESNFLLEFEDREALMYVRDALETMLQPATKLEWVLLELGLNDIWQALRYGSIETCALAIERAVHEEETQRWGELDPMSCLHLALRDRKSRDSVVAYTKMAHEGVRAFQMSVQLMRSLQRAC